MQTFDLEELRTFAIHTAKAAGEVIVDLRKSDTIEVGDKGNPIDLVTTADIEAEKCILSAIRAQFPDHGILSEESLSTVEKEQFDAPLWIVDPIDGTVNYAHNHLQVGISIAFVCQGQIQVGVVHSPFQHETFSATRGGGARLNETNIQVRERKDLRTSLIGSGFPYDRSNLSPILKRIENVLLHTQGFRRAGAASLDLCWVACGRLQAFYEEDLNIWDIAAGRLIALEAGAVVSNFDGELPENIPTELNAHCLLASVPNIEKDLTKLLKVS